MSTYIISPTTSPLQYKDNKLAINSGQLNRFIVKKTLKVIIQDYDN